MASRFPLLAQVAPAKPASSDEPASGPVYRNVSAKDGFPTIENVTTLYELFRWARGSKPGEGGQCTQPFRMV